MTLEMFFDATAAQDGSVVKAVELLMSCLVPTEESIAQKKPSPPLVVLLWCLMVEQLSPGLSAFWATVAILGIVITRRPLLPGFVERPSHPGRHGEPLASGKLLDLRQFPLREEHLEPLTHGLSIA